MSVNNPQSAGSVKTCTACGRKFQGDMTVCPDDNMPLMTVPNEDLVGTIIENKYEVLEKIGAGGMGAVYRARHQLMHRQVAIKMVLAQLSANSMTLKRFTQEARATSQLNHPNILTVFDFGISPTNQPYLVMDFLEGVNFGRVLEDTRQLPIPRAIGIFLQVCAALGHAHQKGIVHRDLKPSNIMLIELDGQPDFVKVLDFGIAKVLSSVDGETDNLTRTGEVFGSPLYMSPEQFRGKSLDARSDIYSLGCVMYRSLAGICPVTGKDVLECMYKHVNESIPPFSVTAPEANIPDRLESIIMKALAKDPDDRYDTMNDLRSDLELCAEELMLGPLGPAFLRSGNFTASDPALTAFPSGTYKSVLSGSQEIPGGPSAAQILTSNGNAMPSPSAAETSAHFIPEDLNSEIETPEWVTGNQIISQDVTAGRATGNVSISGHAVTADQVKSVDASVSNQLVITYPHEPVARKESIDMRLVAGLAAVVILGVGGFLITQMQPRAKTATQTHAVADPHTFEEFTAAGMEHFAAGRYPTAVQEFKKANELGRKFPDSDMRKIESWINLGEAYVAADDFKNAEFSLNKASLQLSHDKQTKGKEYARVQQDLGEMRLNSGDVDSAVPCFTQALNIRMTLDGQDKADAADSLQGLAAVSIAKKNYADGIAKLNKAKELIESISGSENRDYVTVLTDLGRATQMGASSNAQLASSRKLYEKALQIAEKVFPSDHPQIGKINLAFATVLFREGKFADAETRFNEAIRITTKNGGENTLDMAQMKSSLGILYMKQKRFGAAEALFNDAVTIGQAKLGATDAAVRRWKDYRSDCEKLRRRG
ncbi:MAG: protein kinase [Leptolyngbya sp.]|nr:protein kinase [Candidatus Melainabacteria bacterium]